MENTDGSEGNATKISDSAYSNSCGNSQSQRSNSFKSRHSGSNSSGSSGYGGKTSSSLSNSNEADPQPTSKRGKEKKKKSKCLSVTSAIPEVAPAGPGTSRGQPGSERSAKEDLAPTLTEPQPSQEIVDEDDLKDTILPEPVIQENMIILGENDVSVDPTITTPLLLAADDVHSPPASEEKDEMDIDCASPSKIFQNIPFSVNTKQSFDVPSEQTNQVTTGMEGFSCVVSMCDGVVLYTNCTLTDSLDYPKGMWIGRSFIDFIHPKDRSLFVSKTSGTESSAIKSKDVSGTTLFCRIRKYRGLKSGLGGTSYGIRDREVIYVPYELTLTFRDVNSFENNEIYLLITATPVMSPFGDGKIKTSRFSSRHTSTGIISHIEPVAPLGYLPQDIIGRCILDFYHPEDMPYLKEVYETITKSEKPFKSKPYRFCAQNGDYLTIESDWSSFINPWSRKIEFITCNNNIVEGPTNTDVFDCNTYNEHRNVTEESCEMAKAIREEILHILSQVVVIKSDSSKQIISKRCKDLATFMEHLVNECERAKDELHLEVPDETNLSVITMERDSVMLGEISPHHDYNDSKSSTETPLSYNQLNYNENLQRFFESRPWTTDQGVAEQPKINISAVEPLYENTHGQCYSPMRQESAESGASGCSGTFLDKFCHFRPLFHSRHESVPSKRSLCHDYKPAYLTEKLLNKHNSVMEKLLFKKHREARSVSKAMEKDKCERKDKKKDFQDKQSTIVNSNHLLMDMHEEVRQEYGVKRPCSLLWDSERESYKVSKLTTQAAIGSQQILLHPKESPVISLPKSTLLHSSNNGLLSAACVRGMPPSSTIHKPTVEPVVEGHPGAVNLWPPFSVTMTPIQSTSQSIAESIPSGSIPYPGMYPAVYLISSQQSQIPQENSITRSTQYPLQYMMYPPAIFTSQAFMYPPMAMAYQPVALSTNPLMPQVPVAPLVTSNIKPLDLPYDNYHQACQVPASLAATPGTSSAIQGGFIHPEGYTRAKFPSYIPQTEFNDTPTDIIPENDINSLPSNNLNRLMTSSNEKSFKINESASENLDVEASSYSSFYSSFLKTENSNSTEDIDSAGEPSFGCSTYKDKECTDNTSYTTNEVKNKRVLLWRQSQNPAVSNEDFKKTSPNVRFPKDASNKRVKRDCPVNTVQPPWLDSVCVTSELVYKYQIAEKNIEDVLKSDMDSLSYINQSSLVSEQLSQLYMEFKLEGLSEKLTLEEGITSNSSSEEEQTQKKKKRREYAKLVMIYEEDAPMPPPFTQ